MGQSIQNYSFAASGVAVGSRLPPEGRGPFDVSGETFLATEDDGFTRVEAGRIWLGGVELTDAIVRHAEFQVSVDSVEVTSFGTDERTYVPGTSTVVVTIELELPGEFTVKGTVEEMWTGPVLLDQKELL